MTLTAAADQQAESDFVRLLIEGYDADAARVEAERINAPAASTAKTTKAPKLWDDPDAPRNGWALVDVDDLGRDFAICEACGVQEIRYVHQMRHPEYRDVHVGCECAKEMQEDPAVAVEAERRIRNFSKRRAAFVDLKNWTEIRNGNGVRLRKDGWIYVIKESRYGAFRGSAKPRDDGRADWIQGPGWAPDADTAKLELFDAVHRPALEGEKIMSEVRKNSC